MSSQPKITGVDVVVRTADGKTSTYELAGDGHDVKVDARMDWVREPLTVDGSLLPARPPVFDRKRIVVTVTATEGYGDEPLLTLTTGAPAAGGERP